MPLIKYTASADTTITDGYKPNTLSRAYFANMGAADSLELYSVYTSGSDSQKSRILINFPITKLITDRSAGVIPTSGNVNFYLNLYNVQHPETLPNNYYVSIKPVSASWEEGYGLDLDGYSDYGLSGSKGIGAGWIFRQQPSQSWPNYGGDYYSNYEKTFYFDNGLEDLSVDITNIIESQISGILPAYGLGIMLSGAYEDGTTEENFYTKRFSARSSEYFYKRPNIQAVWESTVKDSRADFYFQSNNLSNTDNEQNIYFYNRVNGNLKNLPNNVTPFVKLFNSDNILLTSSIQSTNPSTGIYKATFKLTGSEADTLKDVWYSGSYEYYTGSIEAKIRNFYDTVQEDEYILSITNLKNTYQNYEKPIFRIFVRNKNWSPNIYKIANSEIETLTLKNLYFKVIRLADNENIIDYGISPIAYSLCSYDKNGNYFSLDMSFFEKNYSYGIKLMLLNGEEKQEFSNIFRFKVE